MLLLARGKASPGFHLTASTEHFDVIIIGAGLSGIGAGYRLQTRCPRKRYRILEARANIGGTWDLFRYPGVRSDSDMFTLGYPFRPWKEREAIADGARILQYVRDTAQEFGIDRHIRFRQRVISASWSSENTCWTVEAGSDSGEISRYTCDFLYGCTGYYRYADCSFTPSNGQKTWTMLASRSSLLAVERPRSRWFPRWRRLRVTSPCCSARRLTF